MELARRISYSLSDISNQKSKGQSMYNNRKKKSVKWVHAGGDNYFINEGSFFNSSSLFALKIINIFLLFFLFYKDDVEYEENEQNISMRNIPVNVYTKQPSIKSQAYITNSSMNYCSDNSPGILNDGSKGIVVILFCFEKTKR